MDFAREVTMLQFGDAVVKSLPVSEYCVASGMEAVTIPELELPLVDGILQQQGKPGFISLDDEIRENGTEKGRCDLAGGDPKELVPVVAVSGTVPIDMKASTVLLAESFDDRLVDHSDPNVNLVSDMDGSRFLPAVDSHHSFSVEESGYVSGVEHDDFSKSLRWDGGEFGGSPMPGPRGCGRTIPSQAGSGDSLPGVCNEHVPPAKAKMCSELRGNTETLAEMSSAVTYYMWPVTDCNTKYYKLKLMAGADFVPTPFVTPDNQAAKVAKILWMGQFCCSNRRRVGVLHSITAPA